MSTDLQSRPWQRTAIMAYSGLCYLLFQATFGYLIFFIGDLWVPRTVSGPATELGFAAAMVINLLLIVAFGVQHSVMARPKFKAWITEFIPQAAERATFVLATNLVLIATFLFWQPLPQTIWSVESSVARTALWGLFFAGWGIVLLSSFLINHFELFGLQQAYHFMRRKVAEPMQFRTPLLYRLVRHPLMTGLVIAFWAAPDMSLGRLVFVIGMTAYVFIGVAHEEKDLIAAFGERYRQYRKQVPAVIPGLRWLGSSGIETPATESAISEPG